MKVKHEDLRIQTMFISEHSQDNVIAHDTKADYDEQVLSFYFLAKGIHTSYL